MDKSLPECRNILSRFIKTSLKEKTIDKMKAEMLKENMRTYKPEDPCLPKTLEISDYADLNDFDELGE